MRKIIYTLFVFVFLLGLVSCGESLGGEPEKQPNCDEIDGVLIY